MLPSIWSKIIGRRGRRSLTWKWRRRGSFPLPICLRAQLPLPGDGSRRSSGAWRRRPNGSQGPRLAYQDPDLGGLTETCAVMGGGKVELGSLRDDPSRVHRLMTRVVVGLDVQHVHSFSDAGHLIEVAQIVGQVGI